MIRPASRSSLARALAVCWGAGLLFSSCLAVDDCNYSGETEVRKFETGTDKTEMLGLTAAFSCGDEFWVTTIPLGVTVTGLGNPGALDTFTCTIRQTKYKDAVTGNLIPLGSPRNVDSRSIGNMYAPNSFTLDSWLAIWPVFEKWIDDKVAAGTTPPPFGEFEIRCYWNTGGWNVYKMRHTFQWFEEFHAVTGFPGSGAGSGGAGGGLTPEDLNDQNVNQDGFWQSLFVPDSSNIDLLKDKGMELMSWGPFGLIGALNGKITAYDNSVEEIDGVLSLPTPWGNQEADFRPYAFPIKTVRWLAAGFMWWLIIWGLWRRIYEKV